MAGSATTGSGSTLVRMGMPSSPTKRTAMCTVKGEDRMTGEELRKKYNVRISSIDMQLEWLILANEVFNWLKRLVEKKMDED